MIAVLLGSVGVCDGQGVVGSTPNILSYDGAVPVVNSAINIPFYSARVARKLGLQPIRFQVPSYNGKGLLAVSFTPTENPFKSPTTLLTKIGLSESKITQFSLTVSNCICISSIYK